VRGRPAVWARQPVHLAALFRDPVRPPAESVKLPGAVCRRELPEALGNQAFRVQQVYRRRRGLYRYRESGVASCRFFPPDVRAIVPEDPLVRRAWHPGPELPCRLVRVPVLYR
jgi:hypothetical protein